MEPFSAVFILGVLKIVGSVASVLGVLFGVFKVISWVKGKFVSIDENVVSLKQAIDTNLTALRNDIKEQTHVISTALSEQRQDLRTFVVPLIMSNQFQQTQLQPIPVPARAKPRARNKPIKRQ